MSISSSVNPSFLPPRPNFDQVKKTVDQELNGEKKAVKPVESNTAASASASTDVPQAAPDSILTSLLFQATEKIQSPEQLERLSEFLAAKRSDDPAVRASILTQFTPDQLGQDVWLIGLVGVVYDKVNNDPILLQHVINQLMSYATEYSEPFLLFSVLRAISDRFPDLPPRVLQDVAQLLQKGNFLHEESPEMVRNEALRLAQRLADQGISVAAPVVEVPEAAPLPLPQRLALMALAQRALTTFVEEKEFSNMALLYAALMNVGEMSMGLEGELRPTLYEEVGIVTDSSACIPTELMGMFAIQVVPAHSDDLAKAFEEKIMTLFKYRYKHCLVLVPHRDYSPSFDAVESAKSELKRPITVIDTRMVGSCLGFLIEHLADVLYKTGTRKNTKFMIQNAINHLRSWVVPQLPAVARQPWFKRLPKRSPLRNDLHPVLALYEEPFVLHSVKHLEEAAELLLQKALEVLAQPHHNYRYVLVEYKTHYTIGLQLLQSMQEKHPSLDIVLRQAPDTVEKLWGDHFSLTLI